MENERIENPEGFSKRVVGGASINTEKWPTPDEGALQGMAHSSYFDRKNAVLLFLNDEVSLDNSTKRAVSLSGIYLNRHYSSNTDLMKN